jgi:hypothetical protein
MLRHPTLAQSPLKDNAELLNLLAANAHLRTDSDYSLDRLLDKTDMKKLLFLITPMKL